MKKDLKMIELLTIITIIFCGVTAVNRHWTESWKLFLCDLKNGFLGLGWLYIAMMAAVFALAIVSAMILHVLITRNENYKYAYNERKCINMHIYIYIYIL